MHQLLRLWAPIAFSSISLTAEIPLLLICISKGDLPHETIVAFGLALNFLLIAINPIQGLAIIPPIFLNSKKTFQSLLKLTLAISTLFSLLLACCWILMPYLLNRTSLDQTIIRLTQDNFIYFLPIPLLIGIRRYFEGLLVHLTLTKPILLTGILRMTFTLGLATMLMRFTTLQSMTIGCLSMLTGLTLQTSLVALIAKKYIPQLPNNGDTVSYQKVVKFYLPLIFQSFLQLLYLPILTMSLAKIPESIYALSAWTVLYNLIDFLGSATADLDTLTPAALKMQHGKKHLFRLCIHINLIASSILILLASPLGNYFFTHLNNLAPRATDMARNSSLLTIVIVCTMGFRNYLQGLLLMHKKTSFVQNGAIINLVILGTLVTLTQYTPFSSIYMSILALTISNLAEVWFLKVKSDSIPQNN